MPINFEFTEYYVVLSDDGRELIGIDAGTQPDRAKAADEHWGTNPWPTGTHDNLHYTRSLGPCLRPTPIFAV
jgi:hypothetical protein